jgi:hypothetical protein
MIIENVLYINLDSREDRKQHIEDMLSSCPYKYQRIAGVNLSDTNGYDVFNPNASIYSSTGILGCFLAHKKAMEYLLGISKNVDSYSILIEDDAYIDYSLWDVLSNLDLSTIDSDIFMLDCINRQSNYGTLPIVRHIYPVIFQNLNKDYFYEKNGVRPAFGTHFMIIPNSRIRYVYDSLNIETKIRLIDNFYNYNSNISTSFIETGLVYQIKNPSSINNKYKVWAKRWRK